MVRRKLWLIYLVVTLVIAVVYLRSNSLAVHGAMNTGLGLSSVLATCAAIVIWRPERRLIWILVARRRRPR